MQCPVGQWRTVRPELKRAVATSVGKELFGGPFEEILEETIGDAVSEKTKQWFMDKAGALVTTDNLNSGMNVVYKSIVSGGDDLSKLKDLRKVFQGGTKLV